MTLTLPVAMVVMALAAAPLFAAGLDLVKDPDVPVEKVADGFVFTEGPVWDRSGFLIFTDPNDNTIYTYSPGAGKKVFRKPSNGANGLTLDRKGLLLACESDRRVSRTQKDRSVVTVADRFEGKRLNSPNDLVVARDGSVYFTDPTYGMSLQPKEDRRKELDFSGVYRVSPAGDVTLLSRDLRYPNGIAFSPDFKRLYVNESQDNEMHVWDVLPDGTIANRRLFASLKDPGVEGAADGLKVDVKGNVYSTGPGGIWIFDRQGTLLGRIPVPEVPANCAWGDKDNKTLYITARHSLYRVRLKIAGMRP